MRNIEEQIQLFADDSTRMLLDNFKHTQKMDPQLWIFFNYSGKMDVTVFPIISEAINDEHGKDIIEEGIIELLAALNTVGMEPICILWATEAWVRGGRTEDCMVNGELDMDLVRKMPKKEALMLNYETEEYSELICYEILNREKADLEKMPEMQGKRPLKDAGGRFSNFIQRMREYEW